MATKTRAKIVPFTASAPVRPASDRMTAQQRRNLLVNRVKLNPLSK